MPLHQILVEGARRPIHGGLVVAEHSLPICGLPPPGGEPETRILGVREDLSHVVTRAEAEPLQRDLQRHRASPAEAGADDLHPSSWKCSPRTVRAASASGTCR